MRIVRAGLGAFSVLAVAGFLGCGSDDDGGPSENAGSACGSPADCYPDVQDKSTISGEIICLSQVPGGYCTHVCAADSDCCKAQGECRSGHPQVCAPFESTGAKYCFLSCEQSDVKAAGSPDANSYCHQYANTGLNCRSTGGGVENRQVCAGS